MLFQVDTSSPHPGLEAFDIRSLIEGYAAGWLPVFPRWGLPPLLHSGVRFALEPGHGSGHETLVKPTTVYERKWGDCAHLVVWRLCELNQTRWGWNERSETIVWTRAPATCRIEWRNYRMHVTVRDGHVEDWTEILNGNTA